MQRRRRVIAILVTCLPLAAAGLGLTTAGAAEESSESARIERLLAYLEAQRDVRFVREGKEYDGRTAVDHLRRKLAFAGARIGTVDQFIEQVATRSSATGHRYQVRLKNETLVDAGGWLREALQRIEAP